jgi:NAD(P)-dependent dehydrogenase (short-subunit alcohol dehydrogenase family)
VRERDKGAAAAARIRTVAPDRRITLHALDLSSLDSVARFAEALRADAMPLDILVCNAGIMLLRDPERHGSPDGHELHFATNHLGHFALVGTLLPLLSAGSGVVVMQSSLAAAGYGIPWDDVQFDHHNYRPMRAYGSSKRALSLFGMELQRRSNEAGWGITCNLAHPGTAQTNIVPRDAGPDSLQMRVGGWLTDHGMLAQSAVAAAQPALLALDAALADVASCERQSEARFFGPSGLIQLRGSAREHRPFRRIRSTADSARLWRLSEELSGIRFPAVSALHHHS